MIRTKPSVMMLMALLAISLLAGLTGCVGDVGYADDGPEWDGQVVVVGGGYDGGYDRGHDRNDHPQAFHADAGRRPAAAGSARGRSSMGARGGGHASSGGGHR